MARITSDHAQVSDEGCFLNVLTYDALPVGVGAWTVAYRSPTWLLKKRDGPTFALVQAPTRGVLSESLSDWQVVLRLDDNAGQKHKDALAGLLRAGKDGE